MLLRKINFFPCNLLKSNFKLKFQNNTQIFQNKLFYKINRRGMMDFDPAKDYYKTLGIDINASEKQIKEAYHKLAKKYHPDLNKGQTTDAFKEMSAAYDILSDKNKRKQYDDYRSMFKQGGKSSSSNQYENQSKEYGRSGFDSSHHNTYENFYKTKSDKDSGNFNKNYTKNKTTYTFRDPKTGEYKTYVYEGDSQGNPFFNDFEDLMKKFNKGNFTKGGASENPFKHDQKDSFNNPFKGGNFYDPYNTYRENQTKHQNDFRSGPRQNWNPNWDDHDYQNYLYARKIFRYILIFTVFIFITSTLKRRREYEYMPPEAMMNIPYELTPYPPRRNVYPPNEYNTEQVIPPQYNARRSSNYSDDPYVSPHVKANLK